MKENDLCHCDGCDKNQTSVSAFKRVWLCADCIEDMYELYKTHLMVKRIMDISKQIEDKIKEIN